MLETWTPKAMATAAGPSPAVTVSPVSRLPSLPSLPSPQSPVSPVSRLPSLPSLSLSVGRSQSWHVRCAKVPSLPSPQSPVSPVSLCVGSSQSWHVRCAKVGTDCEGLCPGLFILYPYCRLTSTDTMDVILTACTYFPRAQHVLRALRAAEHSKNALGSRCSH